MAVRLKRAYERPAVSDVKREDSRLDEWARELAPSSELRRWFGHDPERFDEFRRRYTAELAAHEEKLRELRGRRSR